MKYKRIFVMLITASLFLLSSCSEKRNNDVTTSSIQKAESVTTPSVVPETTTVTTSATTTTTTTAAITTKETETTSELVMPDDGNGYPDKLYTDYFIDERARSLAADINQMREDFSKANEFIDFDYIADPDPSDIPLDVQKRAVECVLEEIRNNEFSEIFEHTEEFAADETTSGYIVDGAVTPKFYKGWEYDYDGDGTTERYMIVDYPDGQSWTIEYDFKCWVASALVFEDSSGNISFVKAVDHRPYEFDCKDIIILDYGKFKQLIFGGWGRMGVMDDNTIYGVEDGKSVSIWSGRQSFSKQGCFLSFSGHQGVSAFMIYDTTEQHYRCIFGYPADINKIKELDHDNVITAPEVLDDSKYFIYFVVGERYVVGPGLDYECYKYESGKFEDLGMFNGIVIYPHSQSVEDTEAPFDVDIDYALSVSGAEF